MKIKSEHQGGFMRTYIEHQCGNLTTFYLFTDTEETGCYFNLTPAGAQERREKLSELLYVKKEDNHV